MVKILQDYLRWLCFLAPAVLRDGIGSVCICLHLLLFLHFGSGLVLLGIVSLRLKDFVVLRIFICPGSAAAGRAAIYVKLYLRILTLMKTNFPGNKFLSSFKTFAWITLMLYLYWSESKKSLATSFQNGLLPNFQAKWLSLQYKHTTGNLCTHSKRCRFRFRFRFRFRSNINAP